MKLSPRIGLPAAGEKAMTITMKAAGDATSIGGTKVVAVNGWFAGWFAARLSGTETIDKIHAKASGARNTLR
jgi:phosphoglucomutase